MTGQQRDDRMTNRLLGKLIDFVPVALALLVDATKGLREFARVVWHGLASIPSSDAAWDRWLALLSFT